MQVILVLHNIRSTYNVGAILRTAEGLGAEKVVYSGYTPRYNDLQLLPHLREKLNHQIAKSALGAEELVWQEYLETPVKEISQTEADPSASLLTKWIECAIMEGYTVIGLENNLSPAEMPKQLILGQKTGQNGKKANLGEKIVLVLGEEVKGIPAEIREKMTYFLEIPMQGRKESFNVSVATGIALWALKNCYS